MSCAYIFKDPALYQSIASQKTRYDLHDNDENNSGYRAYFQRFVDFLSPYIGDTRTALDFGCGRSRLLSNILNSMNIECDYYDPIYHPYTLDDSKKYDLIVSTEVFEHLHQPKEIFAQLVSMLKEGGLLAIQTQFHTNDPELFRTWYYHQDPTHIVFFTSRTFTVLAENFGCELLVDNGINMVLLKKVK
jgi:SAM-dependent methyltransferase